MFCSKCGAAQPDGAVFCSSCGNRLEGVAPAAPQMPNANDYLQMQQQMQAQYQAQKNAIRQSEMASMEQAYRYFDAIRDRYDAYDQTCEEINRRCRGTSNARIVLGIICLFFFLISSLSAVDYGAGVLIPLTIFLFIPGLWMLIACICGKVKNKKKLAQAQEEYARLADELNDYYMAYPNCPVGPEYTNPEILEAIYAVLQSGRADTVKDAINTLINDANNAEMEAYMAQINRNAAAANANSRAAAIFLAADLFLR